DEIEMPVGRRIKRAGIDGCDLLQWASSHCEVWTEVIDDFTRRGVGWQCGSSVAVSHFFISVPAPGASSHPPQPSHPSSPPPQILPSSPTWPSRSHASLTSCGSRKSTLRGPEDRSIRDRPRTRCTRLAHHAAWPTQLPD